MSDPIFNFFYIPVIIWTIGIVILMFFLIKKYTFGKNWTKDNPNPYHGETFAMPRGVMRGILTLSLLFIVMLMEVVNLLPTEIIGEKIWGLEDKIAGLMTAFQMMLAFYFGSKVMHHLTSVDLKKSKEVDNSVIRKQLVDL
jgi:hypothetical protein